MSVGDYQLVDRPGNFRGRIIQYHGFEGKGGSVNVSIQLAIDGWWDEDAQAWDDSWTQYKMVVDGQICIVKNDKTIHENGAKMLIECAGWNGSMLSIYGQHWQPQPVSVLVQEQEYRGVKSLEIAFLNPYGSAPGNRGGISQDRAEAFDAAYGPQIRALAGNVVRTTTATVPPGKPTHPSKSKAKKPPVIQKPATEDGGQNQSPPAEAIPF